MRKMFLGTGITAITPGAVGAGAATWPDLPQGIKNGIGGQSGQRVYVGLGSAGSALYSLNLADPTGGWSELAPFPGPDTEGAAAAMVGGKLYVFSGSGYATVDAVSPVIFTDVYAYNSASNGWSQLDTETPVGLLGAAAYALDDDRIAFFGGYNKQLFDSNQHDLQTTNRDADPDEWHRIADAYIGMEPADYQWNNKVLVYTISTNSWSNLGDNPYLPNCGSALVEDENGVLIINGEIKPGLRTAQIKHVSFGDGAADWKQVAPIPARPGADVQDGLAGAFAGFSNDVLLVAGGTNFPGARANAFAGNWYSHKGLQKAWNSEIYACIDGAWKIAGNLPEGLAHGISFVTDQGVLVVGGEDKSKAARRDVFQIRWDGSSVVISK